MKRTLLLCFLLTMGGYIFPQTQQHDKAFEMLDQRGEIYFSFELKGHDINYLSRVISIDKVSGSTVWAYANNRSFDNFLELNIDYKLLTPPSMMHQPFMLDGEGARNRTDWDFYPTYQGYLDIMDGFEADHPDLCEVVVIETLSSGRKIVFIHINDSLGVDQNEPQFMYTSSMHGDETSGYVTSLHLIDYLLSNYGSDEQATRLVNNIDIWINPLANPDGTYAGGNNTVFGATRGNANGIDLNRNFPDPEDGTNPDGNEHQEETVAFMDFADDHHFVMSSNFHDGTEVCNYPWDTWSRLHADDDWWILVCRQWADTVQHYSPQGYFTDLNNGITNGYQWYRITGGRQDYMNYFHHCREFTLEISSQKLIPASQLENIWEYQHRSMLNYMDQALYGVRGLVTNKVTGDPVPAEILVEDHDMDESEVYATLAVGNYHRPIKAGTYDFTFSSFGYYPQTVENVTVEDEETVELNVELQPYQSLTADFYTDDSIIAIGDSTNFFDSSLGTNIVSWEWTFEGGSPAASTDQNPENIVYAEAGLYDVILKVTDNEGATSTTTKEHFIRVTEVFTMKDTTVYVCDALFYDTGGESSDYANDEEITMTFISFLESGRLKITFREFDLEQEDDCNYDYLEAFDGKDVDAPLIGRWCGTELPPTTIITNIDGAITFRFHSNSAITRPGWKAEMTCDTSVGIPTLLENEVDIYPNPAGEKVNISAPESIAKIMIITTSGELILQKDHPGSSTSINTSNLSSGIYFVILKLNHQTITRKLVIQH